MKAFIIFSALFAMALAKPGILFTGAPVGPDGRVVDTPEVAIAKAAHAAAHINEKITLANEAVRSADVVAYTGPAVVSAYATPGVLPVYGTQVAYPGIVAGAPIGADGRVVDTPEVAVAKAAHTAAHINEKVTLVNEAAKNNAVYATPAVVSAYGAPVLAGAYGVGYPNVVY